MPCSKVMGLSPSGPQWLYGLKIHSLHCWCAPRGPRGVKKSELFLQIKLLSSCAKIDPKSQNLQKTLKIEKKVVKKPWRFSDLPTALNVQWYLHKFPCWQYSSGKKINFTTERYIFEFGWVFLSKIISTIFQSIHP